MRESKISITQSAVSAMVLCMVLGVAVRGSSISGRVNDANGAAVSNMWVYTSDYDTGTYRGGDYTDSNGFYYISGIPAGVMRVEAGTWDTGYAHQFYDHKTDWGRATQLWVCEGEDIENIDFDLVEAAIVRGFVKDPCGAGVKDVVVQYSVEDIYYAYSVVTDSNGFYVCNDLLPGYSYVVRIDPPSTSDYMITRFYMAVAETRDYNAPDVFLQEGCLTVSGRITDKSTGLALEGIQVGCYLEGLGVWGGDAGSDANGVYRLSNLPPGEVEIRAMPEYYYAGIGTSFYLENDINNLDFALPKGATLSGRVVDAETAEAVGDIEVTYWNERYAIWENDFTDADGEFMFGNLPGGIAEITARPEFDSGYCWSLPWGSNWFYVNEGEEHSGRIIAIRKGAIVNVCMRDVNGVGISDIEYEYMGRFSEGWGYTDMTGGFKARVPLGETAIGIYEDEFGTLARKVQITDINQSMDVNMTVYSEQSGGTISGMVTNPGNDGKMGDFLVLAFEAGTLFTDPNGWYLIFPVRECDGEANSAFSITALPPGVNYDIYLTVIAATADDVESLAVCDGEFNVAGGVNDVELCYSSEGGTIRGSIINVYGDSVTGATALLGDSVSGEFRGFGDVDANGEYYIYNVPASSYKLTAVHSKYAEASTSVEVLDGAATNAGSLVVGFSGEKEGADLTGDGSVDMRDAAVFAEQWLKVGEVEADFNLDSNTDFADWVRFAESWMWKAMWYND
ncbi:MAG: hypothetical protein ABIG61_10525 [Planctomycetota bacterium]